MSKGKIERKPVKYQISRVFTADRDITDKLIKEWFLSYYREHKDAYLHSDRESYYE